MKMNKKNIALATGLLLMGSTASFAQSLADAKKAIDGICERYLKTNEDGSLSLGGICLVAGLGGNGRRPGTYDYYMSEPVVEDDAKGVGPFLLAYTELLRYQNK